MPSIDDNQRVWGREYNWSGAGDEWSRMWGGTQALWWGSLYPRINRFIPTGTILEIAPGYGRFTQFLRGCCEQLIIVDLAQNCIDACKARFTHSHNISYHLNDGRSLAMIPDGSLDFVFSFDSLVHAEVDILAAYLCQLRHKLKNDGVGFIHHSNIGEYVNQLAVARAMPAMVRKYACQFGLFVPASTFRAESVTAARFRELCDDAGLYLYSQEIINWAAHAPRFLTDCISVFGRASLIGQPKVMRNRQFLHEAKLVRSTDSLYGSAFVMTR